MKKLLNKITNARKTLFPIAVGLVLILVPIIYLQSKNSQKVDAAWFDDGWAYRTALIITNNGAATTLKKVNFTIDTATLITAGKMQSNCSDSRFTDSGGAQLPYYIASGCNSGTTQYWVLLNTINAGSTVILHYYGNSNAPAGTVAAQFDNATFSPNSSSANSEEKGVGPIVYWKFDEGTGATTTDSMGSKLAGILSGTTLPAWQSEDLCLTGKCLYFDGVTSRVAVTDPGTHSVLDFGSGDKISISAWFRPVQVPSTNVWATVVTKGSVDGTNDTNYMLQYGNNNGQDEVDFCYRTSGAASHCFAVDKSQGTFVQAGKWHFLTATYTFATGSSAKLYFDGQLLSGGTWTSGDGNSAPIQTDKALWIGNDQTSTTTEPVKGYIDELKIYRYTRSVAQISADFSGRGASKGTVGSLGSNNQNSSVISNGLVGYWPMDAQTKSASSVAFKVDTTAPSVPGVPSTASASSNPRPLWTWTVSTDSGSGLATNAYSVQWCQDSGYAGCGSNVATSTTNSYTHTADLTSGLWYFRVKATDAVSNASSYSASGTFTKT